MQSVKTAHTSSSSSSVTAETQANNQKMQTLNEDEAEAFLEEERLVGFGFASHEDDILRRASHRLSAMLPK